MKFSGVYREKKNGGFTKGTKLAPKETKVSKFKVGKKEEVANSVSEIMLANYLKSPPREAKTLTVEWKATEEVKESARIETQNLEPTKEIS